MTNVVYSNNMVKYILKKIIPVKVRDLLRKRIQSLIFYLSIKIYLNNPLAYSKPNNKILKCLIFGWGNQGFSADSGFLITCINHIKSTKGPILECGSGLSTIVLGSIAESMGRTYLVLENNKEWADKVSLCLEKYGLNSISVKCSPLKKYPEFDWYDITSTSISENISLVICDGPPGSTRGGRYGLIPIMKNHLAKDCIILLDDGMRTEEQIIAEKWRKDLKANIEFIGDKQNYIKIYS